MLGIQDAILLDIHDIGISAEDDALSQQYSIFHNFYCVDKQI